MNRVPNRSVVLAAPGRLDLRDTPVPTPAPDDVLVRIEWAGICGSDVDLFEGSRPDGFVRYPVVPGHEWSGTVVAAGDRVDRAVVGERIVGENIRPCGRCSPCRHGDATRCETGYDETGFTRDGAWAQHMVVPAALVHALPADADLRAAAVIEPAACAAAAVTRGHIGEGDRVAVVGGGTIGLLAVQLARADRPVEIVVVEPVAERWETARRCGADDAFGPVSEELDAGFDVVIEAAGASGSAQFAVDLARRGGRVVLAGIPPATDVVATQTVVAKQLELHTVFGAPHAAWQRAVEAFRTGALDPGVLVTHELPLDQAPRALELVAERSPTVGKVLLRP